MATGRVRLIFPSNSWALVIAVAVVVVVLVGSNTYRALCGVNAVQSDAGR